MNKAAAFQIFANAGIFNMITMLQLVRGVSECIYGPLQFLVYF